MNILIVILLIIYFLIYIFLLPYAFSEALYPSDKIFTNEKIGEVTSTESLEDTIKRLNNRRKRN